VTGAGAGAAGAGTGLGTLNDVVDGIVSPPPGAGAFVDVVLFEFAIVVAGAGTGAGCCKGGGGAGAICCGFCGGPPGGAKGCGGALCILVMYIVVRINYRSLFLFHFPVLYSIQHVYQWLILFVCKPPRIYCF